MKTLVAFYENLSYAQQAATRLSEELSIEEERVQLTAQGAAEQAGEYFDDVPGVMGEGESMALGAGGGALLAVRVEEEEVEDVRAILGRRGLVDMASYEGELDLEEKAEPTWLTYESSYLRHFEANYAPRGQAFDVYAPAYRFGYTLGMMGQEEAWEAVAGAARRRWEAEEQGAWDQFADAIRFAWKQVVEGPEMLEEALEDDPIQTTKRGRLYQELHKDDAE